MIRCNLFTNTHLSHRDNWQGGRRVTYSSLNDCIIENYKQETYSIKYVLKGTEHYFIDGRKHSVRAGEFLVVNKDIVMDTTIQSSKNVLGFCIHLDAWQVQQDYAAAFLPGDMLLNDSSIGVAVPEIESLIYAANENALGRYLYQLSAAFEAEQATIPVLEEDFYHTTTAQLLALQNNRKVRGKLAMRNAIEQELTARLYRAKEMMDDAGADNVSVARLAQQAMLSEAHFFRLFKQAYHLTPYQYLLQNKLAKAHQALLKQQGSITETALHAGFADVAAFSKAYKKQYGVPPTKAIIS